MKPYLVDVPVKLNIWIRPECQVKQFKVIKEARPSILFLISDGGRNDDEWEKIYINRKYIEQNIDWECTIHKLYMDSNNGLYKMIMEEQKILWKYVDRCIFLEDDIIPSVSFFRYCKELLDYYENDMRVNVICGMNHLETSLNVSSDYFFSRQGSIWGFAAWKRSFALLDDFDYAKDKYTLELLKERLKKNKVFYKKILGYAHNPLFDGHPAATEFCFEFSMYGQNQLQVIPKKNMISCIGCTSDAAHSMELKKMIKGIRRVFYMKTYEISFPLKHPKYVMPDVSYERSRNKIMGYNTPLIVFYRRFENIYRRIIHGDIKYLIKLIKRKLGIDKEVEK